MVRARSTADERASDSVGDRWCIDADTRCALGGSCSTSTGGGVGSADVLARAKGTLVQGLEAGCCARRAAGGGC